MATDPNFTYFVGKAGGSDPRIYAIRTSALEANPEMLDVAVHNGVKLTLKPIDQVSGGQVIYEVATPGFDQEQYGSTRPSVGINPIDPNAPSMRVSSGTYDPAAQMASGKVIDPNTGQLVQLTAVEGGFAAPGTEKQYPQTTQNPAGTPAPASALVPSNLPAQTTALQGAQGATDSPTAPTAPISTGGGGGGFNTMAGLPAQAGAIAPIAPTLPSFTGGSGGTPVTPANSADAFLQAYLQSLSPTSAETGLQSQGAALEAQLRNLNQGQGVMNANLEDQPIALPFITGQESAVEKRYALQRGDVMNQQLTVQQKLALEQAKRQSSIDVNKATLDYATGKDTRADQFAQFYAQQSFQMQMQQLQNQYESAQNEYKLQYGQYSQNLQNQFTQQQQQLQNQYNASQQASQNQFVAGQQSTQDQISQRQYQDALAQQQYQNQFQQQQFTAGQTQRQYENQTEAQKYQDELVQQQIANQLAQQKTSAPADVGNMTIQQQLAGYTPVTLPNGATVYYDKTGKAFDSKGIPVSNETIANSKAGTAPVSSTTKPTTNLGPTTPTQKQTIAQAGLTNSPPEAQSYFLNTPKEFQDSWQRQIASSLQASPNQSFTLQDVIDNYTSWYNAQQAGERSV